MLSVKNSICINLILAVLIILSLLFIDRPLSAFIAKYLYGLKPFFFHFTEAFDGVFQHLLWLLVSFIGFGLLAFFSKRTKKISFLFFTVVMAVFLAYGVVTHNLKTTLKRARPEAYLSGGAKTVDFFNKQINDYSFPSSHAAFYLSLFLPFALAFKRYAPFILFIPVIITIGRVVQNDHYLSDVLCSMLVVFNVCLLTYLGFSYLDNICINFNKRRMEKRKAADNQMYT